MRFGISAGKYLTDNFRLELEAIKRTGYEYDANQTSSNPRNFSMHIKQKFKQRLYLSMASMTSNLFLSVIDFNCYYALSRHWWCGNFKK